MNMKTIILAIFAFVITLSAASFASAASYAIARDDPYSYQNSVYTPVGTYFQAQQQVYYNYESTYHYYDYIAPPRGGGWYGSGTEWLVGLRGPTYTAVPPVRFTNYYAPVCGWPCYTGGWGYPRARASDFPYRTRWGGIYSY